MKRKTKQKGDSPPREREVEDGGTVGVEDGGKAYALRLAWCQRILRILTVAIMGSFLLIIVLTTASTGVLVQVTAKGLYHLILLSALASLATWTLRVRLERKMSQGGGASAEKLKRT